MNKQKKKFKITAKNDNNELYFCVILCENESEIEAMFNIHMGSDNHGYKIFKIEELQVANFGINL